MAGRRDLPTVRGRRPVRGHGAIWVRPPASPFPQPAAGGPAPAAIGSSPAAPTPRTPLSQVWSFDTGGQSQKITQSIATRETVQQSGAVASPFERAIYVTKQGVEGTEIVGRKLGFTYQPKAAYPTQDYVFTLYKLTGTVNNAPYLGFAAGELLFLGVTGQCSTPTDGQTPAWTLTIKYSASPNRVNDATPSASQSWPPGWPRSRP